jgi:two-component system, chemotaxis family, CheB/CheR fusion protein
MNNEFQNPDQLNISRRILVIEDNLDSAETLQTFLDLYGHQVSVAFSGREGLETAKGVIPEVIICDIGLSGELDGFDVAAEVRKIEDLRSVFLIALSGYGQPEDKEKSKKAGFDRHLVKPTDFDALLDLLKSFDR